MRSTRHTRSADGPAAELAISDASELESQPISVYLRRQRELRGISVEELCNLTRIPLRSLQRLESGVFDSLSDGFVRGFVRTVADALGLDPDDTLSRMLSEPHPVDGPSYQAGGGLPRAVAILVIMVLIAGAVGAVRFVTSETTSPVAGEASDEIVFRLDPVRALAESQAALGISGPDAAEAPPAPVEAPPQAARAADHGDVAAAPPGPSPAR